MNKGQVEMPVKLLYIYLNGRRNERMPGLPNKTSHANDAREAADKELPCSTNLSWMVDFSSTAS
jgi:hypothetical protein